MKKMIALATALAFIGTQVQTARAGEREWATAGKILTGVAIGAVITGAATAHANYTVTYSSAPVYYYPPPAPVIVAPARVVCPPPVVYVPPPRVIVAPPPVIVYRAPVVYAPPGVRDRYNPRGHGHHDRYDRPDRRDHR